MESTLVSTGGSVYGFGVRYTVGSTFWSAVGPRLES